MNIRHLVLDGGQLNVLREALLLLKFFFSLQFDAVENRQVDAVKFLISKKINLRLKVRTKLLFLNKGILSNGILSNGILYHGILYNGILYNGILYSGILYNGILYNGILYQCCHKISKQKWNLKSRSCIRPGGGQVSLFVWFVNLFVAGTSFIQRFIYFRNLPELKLASQMGKLPSDATADGSM